MGLYERHLCPPLTELFLRSGWVHKQRKRLLSQLEGRVLEIGFGTGLNLQHYPSAVRSLAILDPAEGMHQRARARIAASPLTIETHQLSAESLPFDDGEFDAVVCTFTLCTIPDPVAAAREVRRVLVPGGPMLVLEHVGSELPEVRAWQDRLNPIQNVFGCGCNLNRDIGPILEAAGFDDIELERIHAPKALKLFREQVRGRARKRGA